MMIQVDWTVIHNVIKYKFILETATDQEETKEIREISEYEKRRQQRIWENQQMMHW